MVFFSFTIAQQGKDSEMTVCWMRSEAAFWSLKSSWEVSRVWELKMRVVDQGAGGSAGPDVRRGQSERRVL